MDDGLKRPEIIPTNARHSAKLSKMENENKEGRPQVNGKGFRSKKKNTNWVYKDEFYIPYCIKTGKSEEGGF